MFFVDYPCDIRSDSLSGVSARNDLGWLYPKNSILRRAIDRLTLEMAQAGIEQKIFDKYFDVLSNTKCEPEPFVEIGYDICDTSFNILIFGGAFAFTIITIELVVNRFLKRY